MSNAWILGVSFAFLASLPVIAEAQAPVPDEVEREAALRGELGERARQRGDLEAALADFSYAFRLSPSADRAWARIEMLDALRRDAQLLAAMRAFLVVHQDDRRAAEARTRAAVLECAPPAAKLASCAR